MPSRVKWFILMLVTRSYCDTRDWLLLVVACKFEHTIWLEVGSTQFIDVINSDRPIIIDLVWNMCCGVVVTMGHSFAL